jgi:uncharacterized protein
MQPDLRRAARYARIRLLTEIGNRLTYHDYTHTADVVGAAGLLADAEGLDAASRCHVLTAAWFHDLGFVRQSDGHEAVGIEIARRVLPSLGYGADHVDAIDELISATKMPQAPRSLAARVLCDADLDVLGRPQFPRRHQALRSEWAAEGRFYSDAEWLDLQIVFIGSHEYFTDSARHRNDEGKARHLERLRQARAELG